MNRVYQLPIHEIRNEWHKLKEYIDQALEQSKCDDYGVDDVYRQISSGVWKLYVIKKNSEYKGAVVVSFIQYPKDTVAYICAIGGQGVTEDNLVVDFFQQLKEAGATRVQGAARPSVVRLWHKIGMYEKYSIVEAKL